MSRENDITLTKELLEQNRRAQGINGDREPGLSELLREQIRLEDRLRSLSS